LEAGYLGFVEVVVDATEHGEDKGGGFACAGLGLTDHVGGSAVGTVGLAEVL